MEKGNHQVEKSDDDLVHKNEINTKPDFGKMENASSLDTTSDTDITSESVNDSKMTAGNTSNISTRTVDSTLSPHSAEEGSTSQVFVDSNYRVMYKEYNLRKTRGILNTVKTSDTSKTAENESMISLEKRERSPDKSEENQAAKRLKIEDTKMETSGPEPAQAKTGIKQQQNLEQNLPLVTSPRKHGVVRKPSFSQGKKIRKKQQVSAVQKTESKEYLDQMVVCALCSRKDSSNNLGFLYGPYKQPVKQKDEIAKEEGGADNTRLVEEDNSLWVHEDCAVWSPGVCIVSGKLLGLHEAVADSKKLVGLE